MGIISLVHGELTKVWGNAMLMRWDLDFMWVSTARAQKYQLHRGVFPLLQQPMPRLPNSNGLWSIVQTCAWSWPKRDCFWIYPQRWRENTLEADQNTPPFLRRSSAHLILAENSAKQNHSGRSEVFTVFAAAFFLFFQRWKEWKIKPWCFWFLLCPDREIPTNPR